VGKNTPKKNIIPHLIKKEQTQKAKREDLSLIMKTQVLKKISSRCLNGTNVW
jgi:hypothetical protein